MVDGIPRFFIAQSYWSELPKERLNWLIEQAKSLGWEAAVQSAFDREPDLLSHVLDTQRASWITLLGLPKDAVALDLGCGFGAVTHSVSRAVAELYSLDAVPENVEFTRVRLEQAGIRNVKQVQASILAPPFRNSTFDLIFLNGVLEWADIWKTKSRLRDAQVSFLSRLRRLLKPGGVIVVGTGHRTGFPSVRGFQVSSRLPYINLMPRFAASWFLTRFKREPHQNARSLTYSRAGYQRLFRDAQLRPLNLYWSEPSYDHPHVLIPFEGVLPRKHVEAKLSDFWHVDRGGITWKFQSLARKLLAPALLNRDFVILLGNVSDTTWSDTQQMWTSLCKQIPSLPEVRNPAFSLHTHRFANKATIQVYEDRGARLRAILKASLPEGKEPQQFGHDALILLEALCQKERVRTFSFPRVLGCAHIGKIAYVAETALEGFQLAKHLFSASARQRFNVLNAILPKCAKAAVDIGRLLGHCDQFPRVPESWWDLPMAQGTDRAIQRLASHLEFGKKQSESTFHSAQHGDLTLANILFSGLDKPLGVIDWDSVRRGLPPLYDLFNLLVSALPFTDPQPIPKGEAQDPWSARFLPSFFGDKRCAILYRRCLQSTCADLGIPETSVWPRFVQYLFLSCHSFADRKSNFLEIQMRLLLLAATTKERFILS